MLRRVAFVAVFAALCLSSIRSYALTDPIAGAVALPENANLLLPFPAGASVRVLSGYSPSGGSTLHADTNRTDKANDYYALDLDYADEANGGKGLPLVAPLPGTVVKAGWATSGWANYGQRVILSHDLGDGHVYHSLYAHMNAIDPAIQEGATVTQGQVLGELGQSCQGALECGSFSAPHLHFALHRDSTVGGSGTGGSYGGNAVVPEPFDGYEDLVPGMVMVSSNSGSVECGDGSCNGSETPESCAEDCACGRIPPEGRIVDDAEPKCFLRGGSPQYWYTTDVGYGGGAYWTHATDDANPDDVGTWVLSFEEAGEYQVEIYVEPGFAGSQQARYTIGSEEATLDQSVSTGWNDLGAHMFAAGESTITLADNTGESFGGMKVLAFDAVRLTRLDGPNPGTGGGGAGTGGSGSDGDGGTAANGDGDRGEDGATGGSNASDGESGCDCRANAAGSRPHPLLVVLGLASLTWVRRRRRALRATSS